MEELLINAGLNKPQAEVYLWLMEHGETAPPRVGRELKLTRTNAYKVLDSLQDLGLVQKLEVRKKFVYRAADPSALASLVADKRNQVIALEQTVKQAMQELRGKYRKSTGASEVELQTGASAMLDAYEQQAASGLPIYFVKTRDDIPFLGFEAMDRVRGLAKKRGVERFGITPDAPEANADLRLDEAGGLQRTWVPAETYTAPVEWTASGDELLIQIFDGSGQVIRITNAQAAESFRQLWQLIDTGARANPAYTPVGPQAKRRS